MADERVNFVLAARDNATATVRRLKGELGAMGGAAARTTGPLGRLSAVTGGYVTPAGLAVGASVALGAAFLGAAAAAMDEERGVALLTTALKENDPAAAGNIEQIEETIRERQKLAFADDEQRESLGALIAVTKDSNKALELQRTAMDLARLKGMSLADATNLIGKVYGGNIGILSRYGIQLERGTTSTEALAEIQRRAAGQAEAFGETTAGAMQSAKLAFDDVIEDVGSLLLPVLTDLALFARDDLIPALRSIGEVVGPIVGFIGDVVGAFSGFGDAARATAAEVEDDLADLKGAAEMHMPATVEAMRSALALGGPVIAAEAGKIAGMLPSEIQARVDEVKQAGRDQVLAFATGILEQRMSPLTETQALVAAMGETLSEAEVAAGLTGADVTAAITSGMASGDPALQFAARSLVSNTTATISGMGPAGRSAGKAFIDNLAWAINQHGTATDAARRAAGAIRAVFPHSEPKDPRSPLRGWTHLGADMMDMLAGGIAGSGVAGAVRGALSGAIPAFGGAMAPAFGTVGGGVIEIHNYLNVDGQLMAQNVTRHQYYMSPAGASVLPRGS